MKNEKTFELYRSGNLIGVFQCEEKGMQKTMVEMGVDRFEDICAGIALFRPGPMASIPKYCMRKRGKEKIDYFGHCNNSSMLSSLFCSLLGSATSTSYTLK